MSKQVTNLQDIILNSARKNKIKVSVRLVNGYKTEGYVVGFDNFIIIMKLDNQDEMLVYKHSISSITPEKPILSES